MQGIAMPGSMHIQVTIAMSMSVARQHTLVEMSAADRLQALQGHAAVNAPQTAGRIDPG